MNEMARAKVRTIRPMADGGDDVCADAPTLRVMTLQIEKDLIGALGRVESLDNSIDGPKPASDDDKLVGGDSIAVTLARCVGLLNRLHVGLNALEQKVG